MKCYLIIFLYLKKQRVRLVFEKYNTYGCLRWFHVGEVTLHIFIWPIDLFDPTGTSTNMYFKSGIRTGRLEKCFEYLVSGNRPYQALSTF